ncbi:MAG: UvrB/UvrC motif-containing protein [Clostridia bacterium]
MKCQKCLHREATVRYSENINGKSQEAHLCYECAKKMGIADFSDFLSPIFINMPEFFGEQVLECSVCGNSFEDYANTGLFGCSSCYDVFESNLDELFLKMHGKNRHVGTRRKRLAENKKVETKKITKEEQLAELKNKLKELIEQEKYEDAALIRDKIKKIEGKK